MQLRSVRALAIALGALLAAWSPAAAQITTGNISGTVQDAQGGVIPGATVVLTSESRGTSLAPVTTNEAGVFVFPNVTADVYTPQGSTPLEAPLPDKKVHPVPSEAPCG